MVIYTIGFTQKSAEQFFELIKKNDIHVLVDVRLNNQSQLAGFTKGRDLQYFLEKIADCKYFHDLTFAPTEDILKSYKKKEISWSGYVDGFNKLIEARDMPGVFNERYGGYEKVVLLCSEPTPENCHRRLVAESISAKYGYAVKHI